MKKILVLGAGGFIGGAMMKRLKSEGHCARDSDTKEVEISEVISEMVDYYNSHFPPQNKDE